MADKGLVSKATLTAIGDAIRAKNGSTTKYKPSEMAAAISEIKSGDFQVATSDKFTYKVVQSANQVITSTPVGKSINNSDGTISLALTDETTISPNTNYIPGTITRSYDDSTHTYTVTATDAEAIDGLVQDGWSVVYQKTPNERPWYTKDDYATGSTYSLQGNIVIGGMQKTTSSGTDVPSSSYGGSDITGFKNSFITTTGNSLLSSCSALTSVALPNLTTAGDSLLSDCSALTSVELPNLTTAGDNLLYGCSALTSVELPNLTTAGDSLLYGCSALTSVALPNLTTAGDKLLYGCSAITSVALPNLTTAGSYLLYGVKKLSSIELPNLKSAAGKLLLHSGTSQIRSVECPKLVTGTFDSTQTSTLTPTYFMDVGFSTSIGPTNQQYTQVIVARNTTTPIITYQSKLSTPVLYIVPSALVDTYKSKVRSTDYVTALETSPFADGKTVCGNNMKTDYYEGVDGETVNLGDGNKLRLHAYSGTIGAWEYIDDSSDRVSVQASESSYNAGFYFLSKLTNERGYTIPTT